MSYGNAHDWSSIISSAASGAGSAMQRNNSYESNKMENKERKRRTFADMLNQAMGRSQALSNARQENSDDTADFRSQAMQQMARGFIQALQK